MSQNTKAHAHQQTQKFSFPFYKGTMNLFQRVDVYLRQGN